MNEEQGQRILTLLERILFGQEQANEMLQEISVRLERLEKRFDSITRRANLSSSPSKSHSSTTVHIVRGITGTWQSLN